MDIPLVNLAAQYQTIQKDVDAAIKRVCTKSNFILGDEVDTFEKAFAKYIGVKECVGVASGTDAIKLMLIAAGIKPGDEVITQANTFISTVLPIIELGATPVLVDVDPDTGTIDVDKVKRAITKKTRAILPVHLYGLPVHIPSLTKLLSPTKLLILEDAAQAHGSSINKRKCGSFGAMAAFSFYPGKNLGGYGDGGAVTTNNTHLANKLRVLRNIGQLKKYHHVTLGFNSRLDTIQAAILFIKLKHLDRWNKKRNTIAEIYQKELTGVGDILITPQPPKGALTNYHIFVIRTKKRDALIKYLEKHGIHPGIHYPIPLHLTPPLKFLGYKKGDFPVSEARADSMVSLPMFAELTSPEIAHIISTIRSFYKK